MNRTGLLALVIGGAFALLVFIFAKGLSLDSTELELSVKDEKIVSFSLPDLLSDKIYTNKDLTSDKPYYLVNFWGSWCPACHQEHAYLMELTKNEVIYGINWKDQPADALTFLKQGGNPFDKIIVDDNSLLAIGMGVYGAPETFLVKSDGTILYRYAGPLSVSIWEKEFIPRIEGIN